MSDATGDQAASLLREFGSHIQVAMVVLGLTETGEPVVSYANEAAHALFAYPPTLMTGAAASSFLPAVGRAELEIAARGTTPVWANWEGSRADGTKLPVGASVAALGTGAALTYAVLLRDRSQSVATDGELRARVVAVQAEREQASRALAEAEERLFVQRRLATQVELLRLLWRGTIGLIVMLAVLVCVGWATGKYEKDSLAMFERILLVLTGMLGTALAGIFDKRGADVPEKK